jgi:hypothetical protein
VNGEALRPLLLQARKCTMSPYSRSFPISADCGKSQAPGNFLNVPESPSQVSLPVIQKRLEYDKLWVK